MTTIRPLSGLDSLFLMLETPEMPMHVASAHLFEVPPRLRRGLLQRIRKGLAQRLHMAPVFTRKLAPTPLQLTTPAWVPEPHPDMEYHVQRVVLPKPGTLEQFEDCIAELHSTLMDRSRPLWQYCLIEGLADGRFGYYCKVHHAAVDGMAGVALARAMFDLQPEPAPVEPPAHAPDQPRAETGELLKAALANQATLSARMLKLLPKLLSAGGHVAAEAIGERLQAARFRAKARQAEIGHVPAFAPRTLLNVSIDHGRTLGTTALTIADARRIAHALGGTINDVVLAVCSGGLRRYLAGRKGLPDEPLIAAVPVSLRAPGDDSLNTQASMFRVSLSTHVADAQARYDAIRASTDAMKHMLESFRAIFPTDFPSLGVPWLLPGLAALYERTHLADRIPPLVNLVISNVPGPRHPLYMAGAHMLTYYPVSIPAHGMALNITVESYCDTIFFGLIACRRALPDVRTLARDIDAARDELLALATVAERAAAKKAAPRTAAPAKATTTKASTKKAAPKKAATKKAPTRKATPRKTAAAARAGARR